MIWQGMRDKALQLSQYHNEEAGIIKAGIIADLTRLRGDIKKHLSDLDKEGREGSKKVGKKMDKFVGPLNPCLVVYGQCFLESLSCLWRMSISSFCSGCPSPSSYLPLSISAFFSHFLPLSSPAYFPRLKPSLLSHLSLLPLKSIDTSPTQPNPSENGSPSPKQTPPPSTPTTTPTSSGAKSVINSTVPWTRRIS